MVSTVKTIMPLVLTAALLAACGGVHDASRSGVGDSTSTTPRSSAQTPTPSVPDPPFTIEGPIAAANPGGRFDSLSGENARVILSADLTVAWIVRPVLLDPASQRSENLQLAWLDDGRLGIVSGAGTYAWRHGEAIEPVNLVIPTATPRPVIAVSSDGDWYAESRQSETYFDTFVGRKGSQPSFRISQAVAASWSPTDPTLLAVLGDPCVFPGLFDVLLFDVDHGSLRSVTTNLPEDVSLFLVNFVWHPDGERIAIESWGNAGKRSRLLIVNVETGALDSIALEEHAAPVPMAWSLAGDLLLVGFEGAHGGLFCEQQPAWEPSAVERLDR